MINIAFIIAFLGLILIRVYYTVSRKLKEIKSYEFDLVKYMNEDGEHFYYTISYKTQKGDWFQGKELISTYKQFLNDYQKELLTLRIQKLKEGENYLSDFKYTIAQLSSKDVMFNFKVLTPNK